MLAAQQKTTIEQPCRALELFPFRWNRCGALDSCFDAFSSREPASTSLENALAEKMDRNCTMACLSPADLQCYSPIIITQPRYLSAVFQKGPLRHGKNQGDQPRRRTRWRRDDPDHLAVHQGQADQPVPRCEPDVFRPRDGIPRQDQ